MIMVGTMAITLWVIGWAMKAPYAVRLNMMAMLLVGVMMIHVILPDGHPLRLATGGDARLWAIFFGFGVLVWVYSKFLGGLKARVKRPETAALKTDSFSPTELDRYARHIILREVGGPGQKALRDAKVLVVGAGGLGAPALEYLAAAGVGTIGVIDDDVVENANLHRQVIHLDRNIGIPKVHSAAEAMTAQNPFVTVRPYARRLDAEIAADLFSDYDLILDGSDNFVTRYLVNETAVAADKPLIAAALTQWEGQISVYEPAKGTPCYACVFPKPPDPALVPSCAEAGVIGPLPGVIGSMMAVEAMKLITGAGESLGGRLLIYDALYAQTRTIAVKPEPDCKVCKGKGLTAT
ncbi:HesA/MoeB/ThiF family protein [Roseobacter sp. CCS2]|uniref:HesA/MoeB/ThiF family protein n=1 Tax=Roseobacter sp. CCS2 TaxID=391593 RepID=UPI0000F3E5C9|nr:molybdopterin-synthase adenylyltransferase MoeB [Roseobacter sp. CCS2]EBA12302.1 Probable molybdopterin biosynthesis protein [Roseobacter sp. CCS2]